MLKVVAQYGLLGQWDFLNIIEAPDEATLARAAVTLAARGHDAHDDAPGVAIEDLIASLSADKD